ncbi:MAG: Smr/MutS family protein [Acidobacteriota bacterium]
MPSSVVSRATESALELTALLRLVSCRAASDLGHQRLAALRPYSEEEQLVRHRRRYDEARRLVGAQPLVPLCERPFEPLLAGVEAGGHMLGGRDMIAIRSLLTISLGATRRIVEADPVCVALTELTEALPSCADLEERLRKTFDSRGEIREDATPRLAELRGRLRRVRSRIYQQLGSLVEQYREHLSEETIPLRGGRLVLTLQAGARGRVPGLLHGRSGTGKSYYFEPLEAVEDNNQLQQAVEEAEAEKRRILAELVQRLIDDLPTLRAHAELVGELDLLQAAVRFAEASGGHLAEIGSRHELKLLQARHPLLVPELAEHRREALGQEGNQEAVVPLDLELSTEQRALVITGPNAGGKTVALKTVGLLTVVHLCGLPIPAARGSRLPFLDNVVATVGDEQDLLADRSTFSGRLLRLREAWLAAGPDSLILLDELGSGTDPEEGAALSMALLEGLAEQRCLMLVTTHLSQLAVAALETDGAFCAAMQFDADSGHPTYRLQPGPPGGSKALALARRLDLPSAWLDRAEELLGSEHRDLRRLLAEVERARQELAQQQQRLDVEIDDAAKLRQRLADQEAELINERKSLAKTMKRQLDAFREDTRTRLRDEVEKLRAQFESGRRRHLASTAEKRLFETSPSFDLGDDDPTTGEIEVGATAKHRRLGWIGRVEKLERGQARVRVNGKLLSCRADDLAATSASKPSRPAKPAVRVSSRQSSNDLEEAPKELNLVGQRVEPALERLDHFLDQALLASLSAVRIIHGHGSGRLRSAVRTHLRSHPAVAEHRAGRAREGGNGATIAQLKDGLS